MQKHARASQVNICASLTSEGIVLDLKDNGVGFDPEKLDSGFGIQGMVERVQLLGGNFRIETAYAQGTQRSAGASSGGCVKQAQIQVIIPL